MLRAVGEVLFPKGEVIFSYPGIGHTNSEASSNIKTLEYLENACGYTLKIGTIKEKIHIIIIIIEIKL